jgi:cysteine synthase
MDAYFEAMQAEIKPGDVVLDQSSGNTARPGYVGISALST